MSDFNIEFEENDQQIKLEFEQIGGGAVKSVNGKTGVVVLTASDVGAYTKPSGGIPKTDLASAVQTSLGKADSAYQKPSGGIPASDIASGVVPAVDNTLAISGAAADAKKTGDEISTLKDGLTAVESDVTDLKEDFDDLDDRVTAIEGGGSGSGLTEDIKAAMLQIAQKVAYIDEHGQDYYDDLYDALYPPADLVSISAVYTQSGTVYDSDTLDSLKSDLVVTAHYSDSTTQTVTAYTLSGTLTVGTSTITVSYDGQIATFNVTVSAHSDVPAGYTSKNYIQSAGNAYIDTGKQEDYRVTSGFWGSFEVSAVSVNKDLFGYQGIHASTALLSTYRFLSIVSSSTGNLWYYGAESGASAEISGWNSTGVNDVTVDLTSGNYPVFTVNGVETTGNKKKTQGYNANQGTIYLMAQNHSGNGATTADQTVDGGYIRCYGFKIFENGSTVRDYKPCTRDSDGVAGFYDTVTDAFYPSIGDNAFTAG